MARIKQAGVEFAFLHDRVLLMFGGCAYSPLLPPASGIAGVLVPLTLDRLGADPAISSSIFVTMTTDSMGFLAFLGLAVATGLVHG